MSSNAHAIETSRILAASRERVWAAFSDPAALARWWGPAGFTNTFHEFDFCPGGAWRFTMHGPDGTCYPIDHRIAEIVPLERIVVSHIQAGHDFELTITLVEKGGGTEIGWRLLFADPAEAGRVRAFVTQANEENLDRLATELSRGGPVVR